MLIKLLQCLLCNLRCCLSFVLWSRVWPPVESYSQRRTHGRYIPAGSASVLFLIVMSTLLVLNASFNYDNYATSYVLLMMTMSLHSFMRSSQAESIIAAVSWLALRRRRPTSCNVSSTRQHESSQTRVSSTGDSLISGEVNYTGWTLSPGSVQSLRPGVQMSAQDGSWVLNTCWLTANPSPAFLVVATCNWLTVVISTSHVWNLLRTEGVHLHMPALQTGTHFLLTLETVVFLFHLLGATSNPFSSLSTRLAHAACLGFFLQKHAI